MIIVAELWQSTSQNITKYYKKPVKK